MVKKKVIVVVRNFPTVAQTFIINQIKFLMDNGYEIKIFCTSRLNKDYNKNFHKVINEYNLIPKVISGYMLVGYKKRIIGVFSNLWLHKSTPLFKKLIGSLNVFKYGRKALDLTLFYKTLWTHFFSDKLDYLIHVHFVENAVHILPFISDVSFNKVVATFHGYDAHEYSSNFYKELFEQTNIYYTANTSYTRNKAIKLGCPSNKLDILPVGLDKQYFQRTKKLNEDKLFRILFVGRFVEFKAPLLAIQIVEILNQKRGNCNLTLVGEGPEIVKCQEYISTHDLFSFINLKGKQSQEDIRDLMALSNVFLYPGIIDKTGRCENQGLVIQEAQAMELPVIISDVGGMKDGIIDNETGFVVKEKDIEGFVGKLIYLMDNPTIRKDMGKKARKFVVENYDNEVLGKKLLEIYGK